MIETGKFYVVRLPGGMLLGQTTKESPQLYVYRSLQVARRYAHLYGGNVETVKMEFVK